MFEIIWSYRFYNKYFIIETNQFIFFKIILLILFFGVFISHLCNIQGKENKIQFKSHNLQFENILFQTNRVFIFVWKYYWEYLFWWNVHIDACYIGVVHQSPSAGIRITQYHRYSSSNSEILHSAYHCWANLGVKSSK